MNALTRRLFNTVGDNDINNNNDDDNNKEIDIEKIKLLMHKKTFSGKNKKSPFKKSHFGEHAYLNLIQSPYATAAKLPLSHPLTIKKTEFYQPNIITWQEYVDMKTNNNNNNNNISPYLHRDSIIAQAKRDFQIRMVAIDGWLSYVNDITKELENSMNIERKLRKDALIEIEMLEREIQLIEEDPYYNSLLISHSKEILINQNEKSPKISPVKALVHTIVNAKTGVYTGDMIHGYKDGTGRYVYPSDDPLGRKIYEGEWKHDKNHGHGKMTYNCGDIYEGLWREDVSHGKGKYIWYEAQNVYDGNWVNGNMHGHGIFLYADGDVYEGSFKDDMRDGFGILKSKTNGSIYTGEWSRNFRSGKGTLTLPDGVVYEGQFKDNIYIPN